MTHPARATGEPPLSWPGLPCGTCAARRASLLVVAVARVPLLPAAAAWSLPPTDQAIAAAEGSSFTGEVATISGTHTYQQAGADTGTVSRSASCPVGAGSQPPQSFSVSFAAPRAGTPASLAAVVVGEPFSGTVTTLTNQNPYAAASDSTAQVNWGDGTPNTAGQAEPDRPTRWQPGDSGVYGQGREDDRGRDGSAASVA
jgi:hypothetical protein